MSVRVLHGDMLEILPTLDADSFDSCVTDPPYHLTSIVKRFANARPEQEKYAGKSHSGYMSRGFMNQKWDGGDIAFRPETWAEVLRVMKPGAFLLSFGGDRTFHRMAVAIEDAGFEIRGTLAYLFGSGFPKSRSISRDLLSAPPCRCGVAEVGGHPLGRVDAGDPPAPGRAGVGAETVPVLSAGLAADQAGGLLSEASAETLGRQSGMELTVEHRVGHLDPVVLRPLDVAGVAQDHKVAVRVGGGQVKPEPLRDEVVDDQLFRRAAVGTGAISGDNGRAALGPILPLVAPAFAAPSGVPVSGQASAIVGAHAGAGAVGSGPALREGGGGEGLGARPADVAGHGRDNTTKNPSFRCNNCGGVIASAVPDGLGTALKPAMELIILARKPLSEGTIAGNVLKHGVGAINIDGCRIEAGDKTPAPVGEYVGSRIGPAGHSGRRDGGADHLGRWPANVITDGSDEVMEAFARFGNAGGGIGTENRAAGTGIYGSFSGATKGREVGFGDSGTAARFFYTAKADASDRLGSKHPTVKPVDLIAYLVRLVTPPGGLVLDCFAGSGTTGMACMREGFRAVLIEREAEYVADINRRLKHVKGEDAPLFQVPA